MSFLKKIIKNGSLLSGVLGLYYLFVFTVKEGIPFPLEMAVLPTLLVALGMLCILFTFIIIAYSLISVIVLSDPFESGYEELLYARPEWIKSKLLASIINFTIFFCLTPLILFTLTIIEYKHVDKVMFASIFVVPFLFSYYALTPNQSITKEKFIIVRTSRFWKSYVTFFYIVFFALLSLLVFVKYLEFGLSIETDPQYACAIIVFFVLSYFLLIPPRKKDGYQKNAERYSKESMSNNLLRFPSSYVYFLLVVLSLVPNVSYSTAVASFKFLSIGGGIERAYFFSKKSRIVIPPELIDRCDGDYCETKILNVILDLGGSLYIEGPYMGNPSTLISLPGQHLFWINKIDPDKG